MFFINENQTEMINSHFTKEQKHQNGFHGKKQKAMEARKNLQKIHLKKGTGDNVFALQQRRKRKVD